MKVEGWVIAGLHTCIAHSYLRKKQITGILLNWTKLTKRYSIFLRKKERKKTKKKKKEIFLSPFESKRRKKRNKKSKRKKRTTKIRKKRKKKILSSLHFDDCNYIEICRTEIHRTGIYIYICISIYPYPYFFILFILFECSLRNYLLK